MYRHGGIAQVAVVGVPTSGWARSAWRSSCRARRGLTPEGVIAWCRENMANYKVPRRVEIVTALPPTRPGRC